MATRADSIFISKLLAPLPRSAEPLESEHARLYCRQEMKRGWRLHQLTMWCAEGQHRAASCARILADEFSRGNPRAATGAVREALERYRIEHDRLMLFPSPSLAGLRWKQKERARLGGNHAWDSAIAADEARLVPHSSPAQPRSC